MTQEAIAVNAASKVLGKPLNRVDGKLKVTGGARYSAEISQENLAYAVCFGSTIARGKIKDIDTSAAENLSGVLRVITHQNLPNLLPSLFPNRDSKDDSLPLQNPDIYHSGQHIGVVIADTLEQATYAASIIRVSYEEETPLVEMDRERGQAHTPEKIFFKPAKFVRGNPQEGIASADVCLDETYTTPTEHHNPMEPHATIALWEDDKLTVYDSTQNNFGLKQFLVKTFAIPEANVRVVCQFIGGAFGCKAMIWKHVPLSVVAARLVSRPVKLVLTRQQMFDVVGHRATTEQQVKLGATRDGRLTAIIHEGISHTSMLQDFVEPFTVSTHMMYACPNLLTFQQLVRLNKGTPTYMRAPGEAPGSFAIESALDELGYLLQIDPIELRLRNYAEVDPDSNLPWSSKSLTECYQIGAEKFGWSQHNPKPGSMRDGRYLVGMGMASSSFPAYKIPATAKGYILRDGSVIIQSGSHEMGTGLATVMAQLGADTLGVPVEQVRFELGDTKLPPAPVSGGSMTTSSVGTAVHAVAKALQAKLIELARKDPDSPLYQVPETDILVENGRLFLKNQPQTGETYTFLLTRHNLEKIEAEHNTNSKPEAPKFAKYAFGAQFVEVRIDPDFGEVRVSRYTGVFACGRILNQKTARSQFIGGITMGIGMALMEETVSDPHLGRVMNANLAEYHLPVNADIPDIDIHMIEENDPHVNPIGTKGIGEIGITGVAAAIANAVYHATGKRIRDLPITPDKVM